MDAAFLELKVTPRSSQNRIEKAEGQLKAWVTAAPTDGQANAAVIKLLAAKLKVAPSRITLVAGATSRIKKFRIEGITQEAVDTQLTSD